MCSEIDRHIRISVPMDSAGYAWRSRNAGRSGNPV